MIELKNWNWLKHIKSQMNERGITPGMVEEALADPDKVVPGKNNRLIYQKLMKGKLLRVVTEGNQLITVYLTSKINKYIEGDSK
jgi:hypothetical protein